VDDVQKRITGTVGQGPETGGGTPLALVDSERLYRALFNGTATAVTIRSLDDQSFIDCNMAALRLYRAESVAQLRGSKVTDISAAKQADGTPTAVALKRVVALAIENGFHRSEWRARRLDGSLFIADIRITIVELEGGRRVMQTIIDDITERKAAEAELRRRAERDELVGRISRRFLDGNVAEATGFAVESLAAFLDERRELVSSWFEARDGGVAASAPADEAALVRLVGELVAMARAREDAEHELRASEERYRAVVERSRYAIFLFDSNGKIIFANAAACELFGYTEDEWAGIGVFDLVVAEEQELLARRVVAARAGEPQTHTQWTVRRKDGSVLQIESLRSVIHDKHGRVVGNQLIVNDVTERHRTDQIRQAAQLELARATEEAVAASRAKSAFVANMSHELRTPLNGVIGMVDLLSRTELDSRQKRYVEVARASASLLLSVINDVLDFSKIEAGKLEMERSEFSLADVIEEVATMLELAAEEKQLELTCQTDPALAAPLVGDPARLRQVLVNLIANAIKFTPRGEVALSATLDGESDGAVQVRVEVRDTGVGISQQAQGKLFQPFSQVDASSTRQHGGTGLGLAICRELVWRMGGNIGVDSSPGEGSTFWFTVRLERTATGGLAERPDEDVRLRGLRVLAVDDNATNREILAAQLTAAGMRCQVASSGEEALERLMTAVVEGEPFALALVDQHMPGMNGSELARRIKANAQIAATRIVMLGSIGRPLDRVELEALGIHVSATKPVWRTQLLRALEAALNDDLDTSRGVQPRSAPHVSPNARRILLVEDAPINIEVTSEILRTAGYVLEVAVDGFQAVEAVKDGHFDLVLMDCQLPGLDGYEATRRIRTLESSGAVAGSRRRPLSILALTASATLEDRERARSAGMDDHIAKPLDARRLLAAVARHLDTGAIPETADATSAPPKTGAVVDLQHALSRLQGNRDLLLRLIVQFRDEAASGRRLLGDALARRDGGALVYAAHRLRGQSLSLDAEALASALSALEVVASRKEWAAVGGLVAAVETEIDRLLDALTHV
jgi:PAS domain S-box-containing protein